MASFLTLFSPLISFLIEHPEFLLAFFSIIILRHRSRPLIVNYPFLGTLPNLLFYSSRLHDWLTDLLCSSNSSIILKGPSFVHTNILLTADPENVRHVFTANFSNYPKGPDLADALDVLGEGIFVADGDAWRFQRRLAHELIGDAKFRAFAAEASKGKLEGGLIPVLGKRATTGEVFDLQDIFLRLTFDTTCMFVFGVDPGCLTAEAEGLPVVAFANAMDDAEEVMFFWHVVPLSWWRVLRWLRVGPERRMAEAAKTEKLEMETTVVDETKEREANLGQGNGRFSGIYFTDMLMKMFLWVFGLLALMLRILMRGVCVVELLQIESGKPKLGMICCILRLELQWHLQTSGENEGGP